MVRWTPYIKRAIHQNTIISIHRRASNTPLARGTPACCTRRPPRSLAHSPPCIRMYEIMLPGPAPLVQKVRVQMPFCFSSGNPLGTMMLQAPADANVVCDFCARRRLPLVVCKFARDVVCCLNRLHKRSVYRASAIRSPAYSTSSC